MPGCKTKVQPPAKEAFVAYSAEELERRTFNYFWELADTNNFQIPDRYPTLTFSSIAATGFGLSAYIVGVEKKYVTREEAANRTLNTLKVLWNLPQGPGQENISGYRGLFYHFLTLDKVTRYKNVELSTIDSGLLMAGVLSSISSDRALGSGVHSQQVSGYLRSIRSRRASLDAALAATGGARRRRAAASLARGFLQRARHNHRRGRHGGAADGEVCDRVMSVGGSPGNGSRYDYFFCFTNSGNSDFNARSFGRSLTTM